MVSVMVNMVPAATASFSWLSCWWLCLLMYQATVSLASSSMICGLG